MHRDRVSRRPMAGIQRGLSSKAFVAELRGQGYVREAAEEIVSQEFGVPLAAARLYVRSHPSWAAEAASRSRHERVCPSTNGGDSCGSARS